MRTGVGRPGGDATPARHPSALVAHCRELRHKLTIYDAAYVALAEALQVPLSPPTGIWRGLLALAVSSNF